MIVCWLRILFPPLTLIVKISLISINGKHLQANFLISNWGGNLDSWGTRAHWYLSLQYLGYLYLGAFLWARISGASYCTRCRPREVFWGGNHSTFFYQIINEHYACSSSHFSQLSYLYLYFSKIYLKNVNLKYQAEALNIDS